MEFQEFDDETEEINEFEFGEEDDCERGSSESEREEMEKLLLESPQKKKANKKSKPVPKPKPKATRGRGRPKKPVQSTVVGSSNQELLAARKRGKSGPTRPDFDDSGPEVLARSLGTNELLDQLGYRDPSPDASPRSGDRDPSSEELEDLKEAITYYNSLWEKYPHLALVPGLKKQNFVPSTSRMDDVEVEIEKVTELGEKPFKDKVYTQVWYFMAFIVGKVASVSPLGDALEPEPTPYNPRPVTLTSELMTEAVTKEARPVVEEMMDMFPLLEYLGNLNDPRVKLAYTVFVAAHTVYRKNTMAPNIPPRV